MNGSELTGYCGLYCGDCIRYRSKASDLAKSLLKEFETTKFSEYAKVKRSHVPELESYEQVVSVLTAISQLKCETPCRLGGDGCAGSCLIIKCVREKSLEGCWECAEYETCEKVDFLKPFHGDTPLRNLRKIKELGIEDWAKHRGKFYPWLK
jgi:hypothetical protein